MTRTTLTLATLLFNGVLAGTVAHAQTIKPGLWEMTHKTGGNPDMDKAMAQMQQQMASMPPAQRKQMEEMLAKQGMSMPSAGGGGMAVKMCITPEMAAKQDMPMQKDGDCTSTVISRSATALKMSFACKTPPSSGEGTYTFSGDTAYTMNMVVNTTHKGKAQTTTMEGQGKWLAANCGAVKPAGKN